MRRPASKEITSNSMELCEAEVSFLAHPINGNERLKKHRISLEVDLESPRSPAKSES